MNAGTIIVLRSRPPRSRSLRSLLAGSLAVLLVALGGALSAPLAWAAEPAAGFWAPTGQLGGPRAEHTATSLSDGRALVAGGFAPGGAPLASAEVYDLASEQWKPVASLSAARKLHSATSLPGGKVLLAGGLGGEGLPLSSAEVYDPAGNRWSATKGSLSVARSGHTATPLPGGKVLVTGGVPANEVPLASAEVYDPATDRWSAAGGSMSVARSGHAAIPLAGGKVLVVGGRGADGAPLASAEVYDPASGRFSATGGSLSVARSGHTATPLPGGKVLVAGGRGGGALASTEVYDPATDGFSACSADRVRADCPGPLAEARYDHRATALRDGRVLVTGGVGGTPPGEVGRVSTELYDPATGAWSPAGPFATVLETRDGFRYGWPVNGRAAHTATLLSDGRVLVAAGVFPRSTNAMHASTELYDPAAPRRFKATAPRKGRGGAAVLLTGPACRGSSPPSYCAKVLVAGGTSESLATYTELYDPVQDSWSGCPQGEAECGSPLRPGNLNVARFGPHDAWASNGGGPTFVQGGVTMTVLDGPECRGGPLPAPGYCGKVLLVGGTYEECGGWPLSVWAPGPCVPGNPTDPNGAAPNGAARAELYDPATGRWSSCTAADASAGCPAPYPGGSVQRHTATLLADGRVLVAGGYMPPAQAGVGGVGFAGRRDFYIYNPAIGRWGPRGTLYNERQRHQAVFLEGGVDRCGVHCGHVLLIAGPGPGNVTESTQTGHPRSAELLDPTTGVSMPTPELTAPRADGRTATLLPSGEVLLTGGFKGCTYFGCWDPQETTERFSLTAGTVALWSAAHSMRTRRTGHTATLLPNGKLLLAGGLAWSNAAEVYDPATGKSVFTGQGASTDVRAATLLPSGPRSVCGTSCGKVLLRDQSAVALLYAPNPEVSKLGPAGGPGAGGTTVTIEGTGLASVTSVKFGEVEATGVTPDSESPDTKLVATSPPQAGGTVPVTVTTSGGTSAANERTRFTYDGPPGGSSGGAPGSDGAPSSGVGPLAPGPGPGPLTPGVDSLLEGERARERALRACLARATSPTRRGRRMTASARRRAAALQRAARQRCLRLHGRTPGPITGLSARAVSSTKIVLSFRAPGSDGNRPPAARSYLVKQSNSPMRGARGFTRARSLCNGACGFSVTQVGAQINLTITNLRPRSTYHYAIAARDNVSGRLGPRSQAVKVKTR